MAVPQADEQQRLLANLITVMARDKLPVPRFWYFPGQYKAVVVATGDDHAGGGTAGRFDTYKANSPAGCSVADWQCLRSTSYVYPSSPLTNAQAVSYTADGFEVALHPQNGCRDFASTADLSSTYDSDLAAWQSRYTGIAKPTTNRFHCMVWSDWASQPKVELDHGMRYDANYYYWPGTWIQDRPGFMNGSGLPMRFTDTDGSLIDVFQGNTSMTDESGQSYPYTADTLFANATGPLGYYGAFTVNMHTDNASTFESSSLLTSAKNAGVPMVTAKQMLTWLDGRNASSFQNVAWSGSTLTFGTAVGAGANRLTVMLPTAGPGGSVLGSISRAGTPVTFTRSTIKGQEYALFPAGSGTFTASYTSGAQAPALTTARTSDVTADSASLAWQSSQPSTGTLLLGTSPTDLSATQTQGGLTSSHSLTVDDLSADRTYYYRVRSVDGGGQTQTWPATGQPPARFTTSAADATAPAVSDVAVAPLPDGTARVSWTTDEPATSLVRFGSSAQRLDQLRRDDQLTRQHVVVLTELAPDARLWVRVESQDQAGNLGRQRSEVPVATAPPGVADQAAADFRSGSLTGTTVVTDQAHGTVTLQGGGTGTLTSHVLDSRQKVTWDRATWIADLPAGASLTVQVRTGSRPDPDGTWSGWKTLTGSGSRIGTEGRYLQYRLTMTATAGAPAVQAIGFSHDGVLGSPASEVPDAH
ncbi:fibronectin type III domain-containing protein [Nocardioides mesophilus]|uniref:Fibronectin type III domain-containing protein n=1 Tax=Nocardioides mesophilus TaxID=433659 RepID=A0A7G9R9A5_9ACTN|nr:fibronectin type III domain-containing protein [Nocardioides mesophilus]QNN52180.1 fibronectin type III domain-containing protein [Nocardioides mesophilus]